MSSNCCLQTPLHNLEKRREARQAYQALYASAHASLPSFQEPNLRWWQRKKIASAGHAEVDELARWEAVLKLEELMHFR